MREEKFLIPVLLGIALVFSGCWMNPFVMWDDPSHIFLNPMVHSWWQFSVKDRLLTPNLGYPLAVPVAIQALFTHLGGSFAAFGLHLLSTLVHCLNTFLLYQLLGRFGLKSRLLPVMIWAVHPVVVESVSWATNLKELLVSAAILITLNSWHLLEERPRFGWAGVVGGVTLGFLSKPTFVVVVPLMALVLVYRREMIRSGRTAFLFGLGLLAGVWVILAQHLHSALPMEDFSARDPIVAIFTALGIIARNYLWPNDLQPLYLVFTHEWSGWATFGLVMLVIWICVASFSLVRGGRTALLFGVLWLAIAYLPYSNLAPLPRLTGDTYAYIPSMGLAFVIGWGLDKLGGATKPLVVAVLLATIVPLILTTQTQIQRWNSTEALMQPLAYDYVSFPTPHQLIAMEAFFQGDHEKAADILRMIWVHQTRVAYPRFAIDVFLQDGDKEWAKRALDDWESQNSGESAQKFVQDYRDRYGL